MGVDLHINGCYEMYGAHINTCIYDYANFHKRIDGFKAYLIKHHDDMKISNKELKRLPKYRSDMIRSVRPKYLRVRKVLSSYESAREYLFDGLLDSCIELFGLPLNGDYVRKFAIKCAEDGGFNSRHRKTHEGYEYIDQYSKD